MLIHTWFIEVLFYRHFVGIIVSCLVLVLALDEVVVTKLE